MKRTTLFNIGRIAVLLMAAVAFVAYGHPILAAGTAVTSLFFLSDEFVRSYPAGMAGVSGGIGQTILDANETIFFERELEVVKARSYDVVYPELKAVSLLPVTTDAGPGAETIVYQSYDEVGMAKIIAAYADDLPRADVKGTEMRNPVRSLGDSYGYSVQEIRAAAKAGKPLEQRKANAARRAIEQLINRLALFGDAASGLIGFFNHPNVTRYLLPADGNENGGVNSTKFIHKTPDQILRDLNAIVNNQLTLTKGVEIPDTLLLPIEAYTHISVTARSNVSDTTILEFFLKNQPTIKKVDWINEAAGAGVLDEGSNVMVAYRYDPDKLSIEIPVPFEQFDPQRVNLEYTVACHARFGGVVVHYPLSVSIGEGV